MPATPENQPEQTNPPASFSSDEKRFRAIFDAINDALFVVDFISAKIVDANLRASELYGYTHEELLSLPPGALSSGQDGYSFSQARRWARKVIRQGPQVLEWQATHKDGHSFWIEVNMREAEIDGENRLLMVVRDISVRKHAEQVQRAFSQVSHAALLAGSLDELYKMIHAIIGSLMPARSFYIALYDDVFNQFTYPYFVDEVDPTPAPHAPDMGLTTYVLRTQTPLLATPDVFAELIKQGQVEKLGAESFDWLGVPLNTSETTLGVMAVQTYRADERLTLEHKEVLTFVSTQVAMAISRQRTDDSYRAISSTLRNAESLYRRAIEAAGAVPYYQDYMSDSYIFIGENIKKVLGFEPSEFSPAKWMEIMVKEIRRGESEQYGANVAALKAREGKISIWQADNLVRTAQGELRWIYDVAVEILGEDGKSKGSMGILQDITDRKEAEERVRLMNEELEQRVVERTAQLEQAVKELESFSYSVSHDLRAPLRALDGYSHILLEDFSEQIPPDAQHYLNGIRENARHMGHLIDDLLAFSRLGRQQMALRKVNHRDIIQNVLRTLQPELEGRNVELILPEKLESQGDPALLQQVWINLLSNAIKFTRHRDPAKIEIGTLTQDAETLFFVKDNGAGFDMKYVNKLFGVFQRLHRSEEFEGTGVGLAIVQRIIQRHGGRIWAESVQGEGATFFFTLSSQSKPVNNP